MLTCSQIQGRISSWLSVEWCLAAEQIPTRSYWLRHHKTCLLLEGFNVRKNKNCNQQQWKLTVWRHRRYEITNMIIIEKKKRLPINLETNWEVQQWETPLRRRKSCWLHHDEKRVERSVNALCRAGHVIFNRPFLRLQKIKHVENNNVSINHVLKRYQHEESFNNQLDTLQDRPNQDDVEWTIIADQSLRTNHCEPFCQYIALWG